MKRILIYIMATMLVTASHAQERQRQQRQRREFNPEVFAQEQTNRLNNALGLDSIQYQAILLMNYADAVTTQDSINARRARAEKMRAEGKKPERPNEEQMKAMEETRKQRQQVRNEQMKQILNAEQYEKYLKFSEEQKKNMRKGRTPGSKRGDRMPRR